MQHWLEDQLVMFLEWLRKRHEKKRRSATPESKRRPDSEFPPARKEPAQKSRHERLRRQVYGRRFPVLGKDSTRYWIQGKEYGYSEIRHLLQGLINQKPDKQYLEEYDRLLESVNTKRFNVADYSYIINLADRLDVPPAPHVITTPTDPSATNPNGHAASPLMCDEN